MTQDEIIEMAKQTGIETDWSFDFKIRLEAFAKLVAQHEREACIVDIQMDIPRSGRDTPEYQMAMRIIERIRARRQA